MKKALIYMLFIAYMLMAANWVRQIRITIGRTFEIWPHMGLVLLIYLAAGLLFSWDKLWLLFSPRRGVLRLNAPELLFGLLLLLLGCYPLLSFTVLAYIKLPAILIPLYDNVALFALPAGILLGRIFRREPKACE